MPRDWTQPFYDYLDEPELPRDYVPTPEEALRADAVLDAIQARLDAEEASGRALG